MNVQIPASVNVADVIGNRLGAAPWVWDAKFDGGQLIQLAPPHGAIRATIDFQIVPSGQQATVFFEVVQSDDAGELSNAEILDLAEQIRQGDGIVEWLTQELTNAGIAATQKAAAEAAAAAAAAERAAADAAAFNAANPDDGEGDGA